MAHRYAALGRQPVCGGQVSATSGRQLPGVRTRQLVPNPVAFPDAFPPTLPLQPRSRHQSCRRRRITVHCVCNPSNRSLRRVGSGCNATGRTNSSSSSSSTDSCTTATTNSTTNTHTTNTTSSYTPSAYRDQRSFSPVRDRSQRASALSEEDPPPPAASSSSSPTFDDPRPAVLESSIGRRTFLTAASWVALSWATDWVAGSSSSSSSSSSGHSGGGGGIRTATWGGRAAVAATRAPGSGAAVELSTLQEEAYLAYAERRFQDAVNLLTDCITAEPGSVRWREMRAQALVDGKNFPAAIVDFEDALGLVPDSDMVTRARLLTGRALAYEGLSRWEAALADYRAGMELAAEAGESLDPYILNSIGNCLNSLGRWEDAREQYLASSEVFQGARGFRGRNGSTTPRLDGAIFAASNAALMRAQLGDTDGAVQEMVRIARRAPGSADMRAALAALYWSQGRRQDAEEMWEFACDRITVGCAKYTDLDWLGRIRRWPPAMVNLMADFLALK